MSEERLDKALEAMRNEAAGTADLAAAKSRVWEKLAGGETGACAGFRTQLQEYADGKLAENRRLLMEDHLGRCADCRRAFAEIKGERKVVAMPSVRRPILKGWQRWAIAAGVMAGMLYLGRDSVDRMLAPSGPRATVEVASGDLYRLPSGTLRQGAAINDGEVVRTGPGARAMLRLSDGSEVEVNERSELFVNAAWSGQTVHLQRGDVIVHAAKQRRGHLRVETRDSIAAVKGTIFAVSTGMSGSLVTVVEGSVEVTQPTGQKMLTRGQQSASNPGIAISPAGDAVAWSQNSQQYLALLGDFATIAKKLAALPTPALRTDPTLLQYMPANPRVYGAIPNLNGTLQQALTLADQQAGESAVFQQWWNSGTGTELKAGLGKMQAVFPLLGDEIVFVLASKGADPSAERVPVILAAVQPNEQAGLQTALAGLPSLQFQVTNNLLSGLRYRRAFAVGGCIAGPGSVQRFRQGDREPLSAGRRLADRRQCGGLAGRSEPRTEQYWAGAYHAGRQSHEVPVLRAARGKWRRREPGHADVQWRQNRNGRLDRSEGCGRSGAVHHLGRGAGLLRFHIDAAADVPGAGRQGFSAQSGIPGEAAGGSRPRWGSMSPTTSPRHWVRTSPSPLRLRRCRFPDGC